LITKYKKIEWEHNNIIKKIKEVWSSITSKENIENRSEENNLKRIKQHNSNQHAKFIAQLWDQDNPAHKKLN
jgi:hypothetical protein